MGWGDMPDKTTDLVMPNMKQMIAGGTRIERFYAVRGGARHARAGTSTHTVRPHAVPVAL